MKKNKGIRLVIACILIMVLLTSCGNTTRLKNEKEILEDVMTSNYFLDNWQGFDITSVEVVKRRTDIDNYVDEAYITAMVQCPQRGMEGFLDFVVRYELYNEGWFLAECEIDGEGEHQGMYFSPTSALERTEDELLQDLFYQVGEKYDEIEVYDHNVDLETGVVNYSFTAIDSHALMYSMIDATLSYQFMSAYGWSAGYLTTNSYEEEWDIFRDYYFVNSEGERKGVSLVYKDNETFRVVAPNGITKTAYVRKIENESNNELFYDIFDYDIERGYDIIVEYAFPMESSPVFYAYLGQAFDPSKNIPGVAEQMMYEADLYELGYLLIGKDRIGYSNYYGDDIDDFNNTVTTIAKELIPVG